MSNRSTFFICAAILLNAAAIIGHREWEKAQIRWAAEAVQKERAAKERAKDDFESMKRSLQYIGKACDKYYEKGDAAEFKDDAALWGHSITNYVDTYPESAPVKEDLTEFNILLQKSITSTSDETVRATGADVARIWTKYGFN